MSPLPLPAPPSFAMDQEQRGEGGHVVVRRRCSSPKTGWISSPLLISPHLHGFSSLFMVVPPCVVWRSEVGCKEQGGTEWNRHSCHRHRRRL